MIEKEEYFEQESEKKEFSFQDGVTEIMDRVNTLLSEKDYVVISISGPGLGSMDVGKTFLSGRLAQECQESGTPFILASNEGSLAYSSCHKSQGFDKKGVIILGAMGSPGSLAERDLLLRYKEHQNNSVKEAADSVGINISKIDLHVVICRPDKPAEEGDYLYNDIVIMNEDAINKK